MTEFPLLLTTREQDWMNTLQKVKEFVLENKRLPSSRTDKNNVEIKSLGSWCGTQKTNYDSDIQKCKHIMSNPEIKQKWEEFMGEFPHLFTTPEQDWMNTLQKVKEFVLENERLPSADTDKKNAEIKSLGSWCGRQKTNYDSDIQKCKFIMSTPEIKQKWKSL